MDVLSQNPQISNDEETKGFYLSAGKIWIYPENYPVRDYQFNIVQSALYNNTLVCLPTGLGKTFIAAVVMYNFWRWYPCGKVIFLAPTKPLVDQQIHACHQVMGIPSTETIQLTGSISPKQRETYWSKKRVIFSTPQVFQNDLENGIVSADSVKCVVIDEAHKALGKHSYCECIRIMHTRNRYFRVLALSATPGNKINNVHEVIQNLHIACLELRDESSPDIVPYINQRKVDVILVPLSNELARFRDRYITIMDRHVRILVQNNVLSTRAENISKGRIFHIMREFQGKVNKGGNHAQIMKTLTILLTMYHAYELMIRHGLRAFHSFYQTHSDKFWMNSEDQLQLLLEDIGFYLGPFPDLELLKNKDIPEIPQDLIFGHNKFEKLKELLLTHFEQRKTLTGDTRAIIFVEYRDIVSEVYVLLLQLRPLIRPQMFVGQAGLKQKQQIKALQEFRKNNVNVLISTSIGEEGLDVGEVDLIICFDVSQRNPTRLVQRMGRTGRQRDGHIIILVTDGKEHQTLKSTMARRDSINNKILNTSNISSSLYQDNPRMIPAALIPECFKMHISVLPKTPVKDKKQKSITERRKKGLSEKPKDLHMSKTKNDGQSSLTKFLTSNNYENSGDQCLTSTNETQWCTRNKKESTLTTIKPSDVKLLSSDKDSVDFLTLCALKMSEKEMCTETVKQVDVTYMYTPALTDDFFDFVVPDKELLNCISGLEDRVDSNSKETDDTYNANVSYENIVDDVNENDFWYNDHVVELDSENIEKSNKRIVFCESKFEDLLDDSTDSDVVASVENVGHEAQQCIKSDSSILCLPKDSGSNAVMPPKKGVDISRDNSRYTFEDILLESSDSSDANDEIQIIESIKTPIQHNINNKEFDATIISDLEKTNDRRNVNNLATMHVVESQVETVRKIVQSDENSYQKKSRGNISEIEDFDFNDFNTPASCKVADKHENKNRDLSTTDNLDESMLSITAAIKEVAKLNAKEKDFKSTNRPDKIGALLLDPVLNGLSEDEDLNALSDDDIFEFDVKDSKDRNEKRQDFVINNSETQPRIPIAHDPQNHTDMQNTIVKKNINNYNSERIGNHNEIQFQDDDFVWDDDFETALPVSSTTNSKEESKSNSLSINHMKRGNTPSNLVKQMESDDDDDDTGWISVKSSSSKSFEKVPPVKLARKLSNLKKSVKNKSDLPTEKINDEITLDNEFMLTESDMQKLVELESSYFSHGKSTNEKYIDASTLKGSTLSMLERNRSLETASNIKSVPMISSFKAPSKCVPLNKKTKETEKSWTKKQKKRDSRKIKNEYIEYEAEVSGTDNGTEESSDEDDDLMDFVSYTQNVTDTSIDMHAHYLQTIKSPVKKPGMFMFKKPRMPDPEIEIYSQAVPEESDSYMHDSFCVAGDEDELETSKDFCYSKLEEAEKKLRDRKRKRKSFDASEDKRQRKKKMKKINLLDNSISSEDETELLRQQIKDESMLLKNLDECI